MGYTTIDNPELYFQTKLYVGNETAIGSGGLAVTLDGDTNMQPDWVWIKNRDQTDGHHIYDSVRGVTKRIRPDSHVVESTVSEGLTAFGSDGFTVGSNQGVNSNTENHVSWNWKESATAGFDIVSYSGTGSQPATVSHSLGVIPDVVLVKPRDDAQSWCMFHQSIGAGNIIYLDVTSAAGGSSVWNSTSPTSSVFTVNDNQVNKSSTNYIAYCFKGIKGYSKFGSYIGNGSSDGTFVYTGFRVSWLMIKQSSAGGEHWFIYDNKRSVFNVVDDALNANDSSAEFTGGGNNDLDILSNGFKLRATDARQNSSGSTYIYMAFAESPFVNSKGIPTNAR